MARKFRTYEYILVNPDKFAGGTESILLRSSWELDFAKHCDLLPTVVKWDYESKQIPYRDPLSGRQKIYIPDFFVTIVNKGRMKNMVFEIKPMHEQLDAHARNSKDAALIARNNAKWKAATLWCDRHGAEFQVLNQSDLYSGYSNVTGRKNPIKSFTQANKIKVPKTTKKTKSTKPRSKSTASLTKRTIGNKTTKVSRIPSSRIKKT